MARLDLGTSPAVSSRCGDQDVNQNITSVAAIPSEPIPIMTASNVSM